MKKFLTLLSLLIFANSVFAEQVTTNRLWKELNDRCKAKISTNNYACDFLKCTISNVNQSYYEENSLWRDGWSQLIKTNSYKLYAVPSDAELSVSEERQAFASSQFALQTTFGTLYNEFNKAGICSKKMPSEMVKTYRGY